jgi:hypothetical protein
MCIARPIKQLKTSHMVVSGMMISVFVGTQGVLPLEDHHRHHHHHLEHHL